MDTTESRQVEGTLRRIWSELLDVPPERISSDANFFALGGDSLLVIRVMDRVNAAFFGHLPDGGLPVADFFTYGTVRELTRRVVERHHDEAVHTVDRGSLTGAIAIIAMEGRFPGAPDVRSFWRVLCDGTETLRFFSPEELIAAGVPRQALADPRYVKCAALLANVQSFDAEHFGLTPAEAALMSPEQRLLIECAQEALETGGYAVRWRGERTGVFVGSGLSSYLVENCYARLPQLESSSGMRTLVATTCAATRISYLLNLVGPGVTIDTACSSSLVAIHLACRALLNGECEMALAGGATVRRFDARGYRAEAGGIFSPDGHCRPFDHLAQGTVASSGAGLVLLKRLEDACADRDTICAVIRGTAVNNDGNAKIGYTAPSAMGQAAVIRAAYRTAGVDPRTIGYVETHGTATPLGDAIEIAALKEALGEASRCALGTLKANMGHMEAAAGVASLIKAALAVEHGRLPPNIHFQEANPQLAIEGTSFFLNTRLENWPSSIEPRRAGVSSFGIGGTNAHAVVEQAPPAVQSHSHRRSQLLTISARTPTMLQTRLRDLRRHLSEHPELKLADVAFSLQLGRIAYPARAFCVCESVSEAVGSLELESQRCDQNDAGATENPPVVFMFPGQGSQHLGMTADLYANEPAFREQIDLCAQFLLPNIGLDIRDFLQPPDARLAETLLQTRWCQPALFVVEYALARLWQSWGVNPSFMIGHSLGEYVAACLSGVFSLEDALMLVCERARLMQLAPRGRMLAVARPRSEVQALLTEGCTIAAVNSDTGCVVAGSVESIASMKQELECGQIPCVLLETSHAFHSPLMNDLCEEFETVLRRIEMRDVGVPYVSNLDGELLATGTRLPPEYWLRHLCQPVEFAQGIVTLSQGLPKVFLEVGPGKALTSNVRAIADAKQAVAVISSCRHPRHAETDSQWLMQAVGQLWKVGAAIDWPAFNALNRCHRVPLPTTPFERRRHWIDASSASSGESEASQTAPDEVRLYAPFWKQTLPPPQRSEPPQKVCLLFEQESELTDGLAQRLSVIGWPVIRVRERSECDHVLADIEARGLSIGLIVYAWRGQGGAISLLDLCQSIGRQPRGDAVPLVVLTSGAQAVLGDDITDPHDAMLSTIARVVSREIPFLSCRSIDLPSGGTTEAQIRTVIGEMLSSTSESVVAFRGTTRWVPAYEPLEITDVAKRETLLRSRGVYLITGGLGGIGRTLATFLARSVQAKLVLVSRSALPADETSERVRAVHAMEALGSEVLVLQADVASEEQMRAAVTQACNVFGTVHGVIHAAGIGVTEVVARKEVATTLKVLEPKVMGTLQTFECVRSLEPDFFILCSSLASILAPARLSDYAAANAFQDSFAHAYDRVEATRCISINWDVWKEVGMGATSGALPFGISNEEGCKAFDLILRNPRPQWIVSTREITRALRQAERQVIRELPSRRPTEVPCNAREEAIRHIWSDLLGVSEPDINADFFESGGDSLLAVQLGARLESHFETTVTLEQILRAPTIAALARQIDL